jgi:uncharacterized protein (TIGR02118 family)
MIHALYFLARKPSYGEAEFHRYWRDVHGPLAAKVKTFRMYVQTHRIPSEGANSPYDGAAEIWFDSLEQFAGMRTNREYLDGAFIDERNFVDFTRVERMATRDHVIVDGPIGGHLVKGVWQLKRKPGMSRGEFRKYWIEVHGALGAKLPGLRRYVQSHLVDEAYEYAEPRSDGVAELWFDSIDAMRASFASPEGKALQADGPKFVDASAGRFFVAQDYVVVPLR